MYSQNSPGNAPSGGHPTDHRAPPTPTRAGERRPPADTAGGVRVDVPQHRADHRIRGPNPEHPDRCGMPQACSPRCLPAISTPARAKTPGHHPVEMVARNGRLVRGSVRLELPRFVDLGPLVLPIVDDCHAHSSGSGRPSRRPFLRWTTDNRRFAQSIWSKRSPLMSADLSASSAASSITADPARCPRPVPGLCQHPRHPTRPVDRQQNRDPVGDGHREHRAQGRIGTTRADRELQILPAGNTTGQRDSRRPTAQAKSGHRRTRPRQRTAATSRTPIGQECQNRRNMMRAARCRMVIVSSATTHRSCHAQKPGRRQRR